MIASAAWRGRSRCPSAGWIDDPRGVLGTLAESDDVGREPPNRLKHHAPQRRPRTQVTTAAMITEIVAKFLDTRRSERMSGVSSKASSIAG